jgi:type IX secretion system PorP/SprF family membrane protein
MNYLKFILFLFLTYCVQAQQQSLFTQNRIASMLFNPACTGAPQDISAILLHRRQWVNLSSAPITSVFSIHTPINNQRLGIGLRIIQDEIYAFRTFGANGLISYKVNLKKGFLSMGLSPGFRQYSFNSDNLSVKNDQDPYMASVQQQWTRFDIGAGTFYYSQRLHAGVSVNKIFSTPLDLKGNASYTYLFHGAYIFTIKPDINLRVSNQTKIYKSTFLTEFSASFEFQENGWLGCGTRSNGDVMVFGGVDMRMLIPDMQHSIKLAYAIDLSLGSSLTQRPCHEIALVAGLKAWKKKNPGVYYKIL